MRSCKKKNKKKKKKKTKKKKKGAFLSQIVGKLLGDSKPPPQIESSGEIDGNIIMVSVCCGTLNVEEHVEHEKDSNQERTDDDD